LHDAGRGADDQHAKQIVPMTGFALRAFARAAEKTMVPAPGARWMPASIAAVGVSHALLIGGSMII
jgi:hypothetical protein